MFGSLSLELQGIREGLFVGANKVRQVLEGVSGMAQQEGRERTLMKSCPSSVSMICDL
jgi:hypothetical protein